MNKCYRCTHRGTVPGSAHSCCLALKRACGDNIQTMELELLLASHQCKIEAKDITGQSKPLVNINPQGIRGGWASWPLDFDPVWISECLLFDGSLQDHEDELARYLAMEEPNDSVAKINREEKIKFHQEAIKKLK